MSEKKGTSDVDRETETKRPLADRLNPILASALFASLLTTVLGGWLTARAQIHQLRVDRRISALKEYAASCYEYNRHLVAQYSNIRWAAGAAGRPGKEEFARGQIEAIDKEMAVGQAAHAALATNVAVVNALYKSTEDPLAAIRFGTRDPPPPNEPADARAKAVKEVIELFRTNLNTFGNRCDESVSRLAPRIEESGP